MPDSTVRPDLRPDRYRRVWTDILRLNDPAAGTILSRIIPGEAYERLESVAFTVSTSAAGGDRDISVEFTDIAGNVFHRAVAGNVQSVSLTRQYSFAVWGAPHAGLIGPYIAGTLAPIILSPAMRWRIQINDIEAADTITAAFAFVTRFSTES